MFATITSYIATLSGSILSVPEPMSVLLLGLTMIALSETLRRPRRSASAEVPVVQPRRSGPAREAAGSLEPVAG
jgi:hypothetical protein